jgi:hypothetical protein
MPKDRYLSSTMDHHMPMGIYISVSSPPCYTRSFYIDPCRSCSEQDHKRYCQSIPRLFRTSSPVRPTLSVHVSAVDLAHASAMSPVGIAMASPSKIRHCKILVYVPFLFRSPPPIRDIHPDALRKHGVDSGFASDMDIIFHHVVGPFSSYFQKPHGLS